MKNLRPLIAAPLLCSALPALAYEHTKTLPRGRFNLNVRSIATDIASKSGSSGASEGLAAPLERDLTFNDVLRNQSAISPTRAAKVEGFMLANDLERSDALGRFSASAKASVRATAPILAWGVSDKVTLAVGAPYMVARSTIAVDFARSDTAAQFLALLSDPANNQHEAALELQEKLGAATAELNRELAGYGVDPLTDWQGSGWGDTTVAAKWRAWESGPVAMAATFGTVLPTGRPDEARVMNDVPFGDGQTDVFLQATSEQSPIRGFSVSQSIKYTYQNPGQREVFRGLEPEDLEEGTTEATFKPGDRIDAALGMAWAHPSGVTASVGWQANRKWRDRWQDREGRRIDSLESNSDQLVHLGELAAGFSTVEGYFRGEYPAPAEVSVAVARQVASRNSMESDLYEMSASLFF
jgi:hypothetical protein